MWLLTVSKSTLVILLMPVLVNLIACEVLMARLFLVYWFTDKLTKAEYTEEYDKLLKNCWLYPFKTP